MMSRVFPDPRALGMMSLWHAWSTFVLLVLMLCVKGGYFLYWSIKEGPPGRLEIE